LSEKIALLYARVSTNRQAENGHSLDSQAALLKTKAEAQGYRVEIVLENGSGRKANRPKLNEALDRLNRKEAQALFALDIDRLARSTRHALEIAEMAKRKGWRLVIASLDIDTETAIGEMMLGQLAIFAQFESRMTGERVKRQHQARRERGIVWGVDEGFRGNLSPKTRALIVKLNQEGLSLREIIKQLEAKGLKTARGGVWQPATISAILKSPQSKALVKA
jgi:DNA invertase Pin-like site-specific DNA recombinase